MSHELITAVYLEVNLLYLAKKDGGHKLTSCDLEDMVGMINMGSGRAHPCLREVES